MPCFALTGVGRVHECRRSHILQSATARVFRPASQHRHRLNPRGNRQLNWAIHVIAICQLRNPGPGRDYYDRKRAEGKSTKEALRALKRQISNVVYRTMLTDARHAH